MERKSLLDLRAERIGWIQRYGLERAREMMRQLYRAEETADSYRRWSERSGLKLGAIR